MSFISETASGIKSRFGFHDHHMDSSMPSVRSTPDLQFKSAVRDNAKFSAIRSIRDREDQVFEFHDDPSFWKDHNVQVIIRVRPLSSSEISLQGSNKCVRQESGQTITWTGPPESRFTFDHVADEHVTQEMLFKVAGLPMVENCMGGYNSCMFAYGQTGSGKTHTMLGDIEGGSRRHNVNSGMTPRVFEHLFSRIQKDREARRDEKLQFTCKCSFLEIYNEQILDLLDPSSVNLQIREDTKKGVYVDNLTEVEVNNARDVIQQLVQGAANRKVASTNMNCASSRSHSVFTCIIESKWEVQGVTHHRFSRLNLVDLAGSERQKSSGAEGERLKEATNINKSLSTLGLVIMNLVNVSNGKSLHVPYRDSKLTFLLQDSLGGNSKTTIIANVSPSICCSLETLSTLKFAQRAKYIKNHATVNEDASGDVLAMRMQIQELKKEVLRLQNLANRGAGTCEVDAWSLSFPESPGMGSFKWEGIHGSFSSPLTSSKRISQKKEYEVALVNAFRREKDKDITLQALTAECQAAMQLAKQKEAENQGLKMRLRFREAAIKRLEAVASGKISAEPHLLKEKEEHLKEIDVLSTQVDRNQEVTRFAMENLRLKEEIRRLKSFFEEGERERMNEQITLLQNKLLEALDWKLMHESDTSVVQKNNIELAMDLQDDGHLFVPSKEPSSPRCKQKSQTEIPPLTTDCMPTAGLSDQIELETMVDAIAAASQREAKLQETAIILTKENNDLKMKLKQLIEDNNRLIELYEQAVAERQNDDTHVAENAQDNIQEHSNQFTHSAQEKELELTMEVKNLEHQLMEMHEENENLLGLYETAMQERDEFKRLLSSGGQKKNSNGGYDCAEEKLVEVDGVEGLMSDVSPFPGNDSLVRLFVSHAHVEEGDNSQQFEKFSSVSGEAEVLLEETDLMEVQVHDEYSSCSSPRISDYVDVGEPSSAIEAKNNVAKSVIFECNDQDGDIEDSQIASNNLVIKSQSHPVGNISNDLKFVRRKLDKAQELLLNSSQTVALFGSLERANIEIDRLLGEIEASEESAQMRQQECESSKCMSSELQERRNLLEKKLMAIKYSISSFSSSIGYFEQRELQARARTNSALTHLNQTQEKLVRLQASRHEIEDAQRKMKISELELKNNIAVMKLKLEEENRRYVNDNDKVLISIDNVDRTKLQAVLGGKATELLRSTEEKSKLQAEIMQGQEQLGNTRTDIVKLTRKLGKLDGEIQAAQVDLERGLLSLEEMQKKLQGITKEKETLLEMEENGKSEFEYLLLEYHQCMFEAELKEEEMRILEDELQLELKKVVELRAEKAMALKKKIQLQEVTMGESCFVSEKVEEELQNVCLSFLELRSLLGDDITIYT